MKSKFNMKNKKGQALLWIIAIAVIVLVVAVIGFLVVQSTGVTPAQVAGAGAVSSVIEETQTGKVAQIKVFVRDMAATDINTKKAVPVYCVDSKGNFIIDATSSSTTTQISGSTTRGETITCWAFNSTFQTLQPTVIPMDTELEQVLIDGYTVSIGADIEFFDSTLTKANNGSSNISIGAEGSDSYDKMKFKNNNTNQWIPLGGFYFNTITGSNVSNLDVSGGAVVKAKNHGSSTQVESSTLGTAVTTRRDNWDYVFEIADTEYSAGGNSGSNPLILEGSDYIETRTVNLESSVGCIDATATDVINVYGFTKGYYRGTKSAEVLYGHETDASAAAVITADLTEPSDSRFFCTATGV